MGILDRLNRVSKKEIPHATIERARRLFFGEKVAEAIALLDRSKFDREEIDRLVNIWKGEALAKAKVDSEAREMQSEADRRINEARIGREAQMKMQTDAENIEREGKRRVMEKETEVANTASEKARAEGRAEKAKSKKGRKVYWADRRDSKTRKKAKKYAAKLIEGGRLRWILGSRPDPEQARIMLKKAGFSDREIYKFMREHGRGDVEFSENAKGAIRDIIFRVNKAKEKIKQISAPEAARFIHEFTDEIAGELKGIIDNEQVTEDEKAVLMSKAGAFLQEIRNELDEIASENARPSGRAEPEAPEDTRRSGGGGGWGGGGGAWGGMGWGRKGQQKRFTSAGRRQGR